MSGVLYKTETSSETPPTPTSQPFYIHISHCLIKMPSALSPSEALPLPKWQRPAKTSHDLPWADIKVLDLSTFDEPGGKEKLAEELRDAVCY